MGFYINIRFVKLNSKGIPVWYTSFGEPAKYRKIDPDASRHSFEDCKARRMSKFEEMKPFLEKQGSKVFEVLSTQSCEPYTTDDCLKREKPEFVRNTIDPKTLLKELSKVRKIFREAKRPPTVKKLFVDGKTGYSVEGYFPQFYKIEMRDFDHMTIVPVVESKDFDLEGLRKDMIGKYKKEIKALEKYTDYEKLKKKVKKYIETEYEFICETFGKDFKQTKDKYVERKINGMITDFMRKIKRFKYEIKKIKSDAEKSLFADLYKYNKEFQERGAEKVKTFVKGSRITLYRKYDPETGKFSGKFVVTQKKVPLLEDNMDTLQDLEKACRYAIKKGYLLKKVYT